jgi:hypothetical protein
MMYNPQSIRVSKTQMSCFYKDNEIAFKIFNDVFSFKELPIGFLPGLKSCFDDDPFWTLFKQMSQFHDDTDSIEIFLKFLFENRHVKEIVFKVNLIDITAEKQALLN